MKEGHLPEPYIRGLANAQLLGRAQLLKDPLVSSLTFFLDGAHSPESMEICGKWFCSAVHKANSSFKKNKEMQHVFSSNGQEILRMADSEINTSSARVRCYIRWGNLRI
jgi:folylpolyglutamate synthase